MVEAAEVALGIDQGHVLGEVLPEADQGVVDRAVAVGVELGHHVADHVGALAMGPVGHQPHLPHRVQDPALHRLEAVAHVGDGPRGDDRERVGEERLAELLVDRHVDDLSSEGEQFALGGHGVAFGVPFGSSGVRGSGVEIAVGRGGAGGSGRRASWPGRRHQPIDRSGRTRPSTAGRHQRGRNPARKSAPPATDDGNRIGPRRVAMAGEICPIGTVPTGSGPGSAIGERPWTPSDLQG